MTALSLVALWGSEGVWDMGPPEGYCYERRQTPFKLTRTQTQTQCSRTRNTEPYCVQESTWKAESLVHEGEWRLGRANNISGHVKREFEAALQCSTARFCIYA
ncbi:hypothetical protein EDB19DRAFT_1838355 [Suillus lakei]|nr:hypothetical protein EDB19DRAFT_1838355 [Suillus lakei]